MGQLRNELIVTALFLFAAFAHPGTGHAQDLGRGEQGFVNRYASPGSSTIQVYVWGSVRNPGIWRIEPNLDLVELLSAVGVAGVGEDQLDFSQHVNLRIYRTIEGNRRMIYEERLDDVLAESATYPPLQESDVLEVETERRRQFGFQFFSQIVGTTATLALLILRLTGGR